MSDTGLESELYKRLKLLGEGSSGKAYLVEHITTGKKYVLKQFDIKEIDGKNDPIKEAKILETLNHPNIIKFHDIYKTKNGKLCIIMDYADGSDLATKIKQMKGRHFNENQILDWFTQITLALKYVHDLKILHRDLKCSNIFLTKSNIIKLGDFGIARIFENTIDKAKTMVGTLAYLSPEQVNGKKYDFMADIWSLGVVLYELCALKRPFEGNGLGILITKIAKGDFIPIPQTYSKELDNLVNSLLQVDPSKRPTIKKILRLPIIQNRIRNFMKESIKITEACQLRLQEQNLLGFTEKLEEIKIMDSEESLVNEEIDNYNNKSLDDVESQKIQTPKRNNRPQTSEGNIPSSNNRKEKTPNKINSQNRLISKNQQRTGSRSPYQSRPISRGQNNYSNLNSSSTTKTTQNDSGNKNLENYHQTKKKSGNNPTSSATKAKNSKNNALLSDNQIIKKSSLIPEEHIKSQVNKEIMNKDEEAHNFDPMLYINFNQTDNQSTTDGNGWVSKPIDDIPNQIIEDGNKEVEVMLIKDFETFNDEEKNEEAMNIVDVITYNSMIKELSKIVEDDNDDDDVEELPDFNKIEVLKQILEGELGTADFLKAYNIARELISKESLDSIREKYAKNDHYGSIFPFLSLKAREQYLPYIVTVVILEEQFEKKNLLSVSNHINYINKKGKKTHEKFILY